MDEYAQQMDGLINSWGFLNGFYEPKVGW